jgi:hypothetical protein
MRSSDQTNGYPKSDYELPRLAERLAQLTPAELFQARCEARALLYATGELTLHDAVDALQAAAIACGLVASIGQEAVQAIMAVAFREAGRHV